MCLLHFHYIIGIMSSPLDCICRRSNLWVCCPFFNMQKENAIGGTAPPRRTHTAQSSKISSSDGRVERPPMIDISNKLHALVDEFVSNLTSECDSLAQNVSAEAHMYVAPDRALAGSQTQRPSNRTTSEVLNGLIRPTSTPLTSSHNREGKSHVQHGKPDLQTGTNRNREQGKDLRILKDMKAKSATLLELDDTGCVKGVDPEIDNILSRELGNHRGMPKHPVSKGRLMHDVELLSSDSASDVSNRARAKHAARTRCTQPATKARLTTSQGRSRRMETRSPSRSPESSHSKGYSYDEDTPSLGGTRPHGETTFPKLRWPLDSGGSHEEGGTAQKSDNNGVHITTEYQSKHERKKSDVDLSLEEGDESDGDDTGLNPIQTESDGEEMPVLPRVPVKRKVVNQPRVRERRTQRGSAKSTSPQTKRQRTPQIDASVITQLEFGRRPENCVSIPSPWL